MTANVTPGGLETLPDLGDCCCFSSSTFPAGVRGFILPVCKNRQRMQIGLFILLQLPRSLCLKLGVAVGR